MSIPARTCVAAILGPAIAALLTYLIDSGMSGSLRPAYYLALYVVFLYLFSLIPALVTIVALKSTGHTRFWHFVLGGVVTAALGMVVFVLYSHGLDLIWSELAELSPLLAVGAVAAALVWVLSEWRPFPSSADEET